MSDKPDHTHDDGAKVVLIRELFKTIRRLIPSKKFMGVIVLIGTIAWNVNAGYVTVADIQALAASAVEIVRATIPGGVSP